MNNVHPMDAQRALGEPVNSCEATNGTFSFDPGTVIIRIDQVLAITGLSRASIYEYQRTKGFPKSVPLSDSSARNAPVGFVLAEVQEWVRQRIAKRGEVA